MARTAWSYGSRMAFFDQKAGQIAELEAGASGWMARAAAS